MKWYKKLYLGDNAKDARYKIFGRIKMGRFQKDTYLITLSDNPNNLLNIYSANMLLQPRMKRTHVLDNIYVVGLAKGYDEALLVVQEIIGEVYNNTGKFNLREYLKFGNNSESMVSH